MAKAGFLTRFDSENYTQIRKKLWNMRPIAAELEGWTLLARLAREDRFSSGPWVPQEIV
jgi:hypothetical protein